MPRAAVVGCPVGHSRSPALHRAAYAALGLDDWSYEGVQLDATQFPAWFAGLDSDWAGLSCTMPLKRVAREVADVRSPIAEVVGAANTLVRRERGWVADNTDVDGVLGALADIDALPGPDTSVLLLGAGGTAQAVLAALAHCGVREVDVATRSPANSEPLLATADRLAITVRLRPIPTCVSAELVVSTLPPTARLAVARWEGVSALLDVGYGPQAGALVGQAASAGVRVATGLEMLLHQAGRQVELMTGQPAPLAAMRVAIGLGQPSGSG